MSLSVNRQRRSQSRSAPGILGIFLVSLLAASSLLAEDDGPAFTDRELEALANLPKIPERQKRAPGELAFAVFSYGKNGEDYFYLRDEKPERILFNTGVVRRFQFGGEAGRLVIYKRLANDEGELQFIPVGTVAPPSGSRDGIVLFRPNDADGTKKARKLPFIDLSKKSFKPNDIRLVNMTTQPLVVHLNSKPIKLPPMKDVTVSNRAGASVYQVKVGMAVEKKLKTVYSNVFQTEPENRTMLMIVPDWTNSSAGTPIRCMTYKDSGAVSG